MNETELNCLALVSLPTSWLSKIIVEPIKLSRIFSGLFLVWSSPRGNITSKLQYVNKNMGVAD